MGILIPSVTEWYETEIFNIFWVIIIRTRMVYYQVRFSPFHCTDRYRLRSVLRSESSCIMDPSFFDLQSDPSKTATSLAVGFFDPFDKDSDIVYNHDWLHVRKLLYIIASFYPFIEHITCCMPCIIYPLFSDTLCADFWLQSTGSQAWLDFSIASAFYSVISRCSTRTRHCTKWSSVVSCWFEFMKLLDFSARTDIRYICCEVHIGWIYTSLITRG